MKGLAIEERLVKIFATSSTSIELWRLDWQLDCAAHPSGA